jgi:uncharacterized membrane protein YbhN (UPF0104 family)
MLRRATEIDRGADPARRPTDTQPARSHGWWAWFSGALLLLAVLLVATHVAEERELARLLRDARPGWLLVAAILQLLTYVCAAAVWQRALVYRGIAAPLAPLVPLGFAKLFTDQALPSAGMSGTVLVVRGLERRGTDRSDAVSAVVSGLVAYQLGYLVVTVSAVAIVWQRGELGILALVPATAVCLLALTFPWLVVALVHASKRGSVTWLARWPGARDVATALGATDPRRLFAPRLLLETVACQLAIFALDAVTLAVMLRAVGVAPDLSIVFASFVGASVVSTLAWVPGGLGTFEATCIALLHVHAVSIEASLAATLLLRGFTFWLPMLPGFVLARRELEGGGTAPRSA